MYGKGEREEEENTKKGNWLNKIEQGDWKARTVRFMYNFEVEFGVSFFSDFYVEFQLQSSTKASTP